MAVVTICFHCFSIYLLLSDGTRCHLVFWMLSFKPAFSVSFTFIKGLFSSSSLSAIRWCHLCIYPRKLWLLIECATCMCVCSLSLVQLFVIPSIVACRAPLSSILASKSIYFSSAIKIYRILEWVAVSFSRGSSWYRGRTHISFICRRILYHWATREAPGSLHK